MKPDVNNPGPVEATHKPADKELDLQKSAPEQALDKVGEQPISTGGAVQATTAAPVQQPVNQPVVSTQQTTQPAANITARDQFENQIAQLPAEDSDVIEKVWVDKADEIVEKTKDDPFLEDEAQHSLSRAYLKKRFNLDVD